MGNALEGSARFTFEGQDYLLVLNNRVWIEAENILGYSILDVVEELRVALESGRNPKLAHMAAVVCGGLRQNHPDISEDDVLGMFFSGDAGFRNAVLEAMQGAQMPTSGAATASAVGNAQKRKAPGGTGKTSSSAGARAGSRRTRSG